VDFTPLSCEIKRHIFRRKQLLESAADKSWVIHPEETVDYPPALTLSNPFERVTQYAPHRTLAVESCLVEGRPLVHAPLKAYLHKNATFCNGTLYAGCSKTRYTDKVNTRLIHHPTYIPSATLCSSQRGAQFFAHWLIDDAAAKVYAKEQGDVAIEVERTPYLHEPGYSKLFELPCESIKHAKIGELLIFDNYGSTSHKLKSHQRLRHKVSLLNLPQTAAGIYIRRGSSGLSRILLNEQEIENFLSHAGFKIVDPSVMTVDQLLSTMFGTPLIIGVEGSQLGHSLLTMRDGGTLITLTPPYRFSNYHAEWLGPLGMRYGTIVGLEEEGGFTIPIHEIEELLNLIQAS